MAVDPFLAVDRLAGFAHEDTLVVASLATLFFSAHDATWARDALVQLGRAAPMGLPALIAAVAAVLIALYRAVEKVFSEPDFADKPRVSQPDAFA